MSIDQAMSLKALQLYDMATAWSELQAEKPIIMMHYSLNVL